MILMSALLATLLLIATFAFFVIAVTAYVTVIWRKRSPVSYFDLSVLGKQGNRLAGAAFLFWNLAILCSVLSGFAMLFRR
jgi:hypothetical protein